MSVNHGSNQVSQQKQEIEIIPPKTLPASRKWDRMKATNMGYPLIKENDQKVIQRSAHHRPRRQGCFLPSFRVEALEESHGGGPQQRAEGLGLPTGT